MIWMLEDTILGDAQQKSANLPDFMRLAGRQQWNKRVRCGVRVGPLGLEEARTLFHDPDERLNDSHRDVPVKTTWAIGPMPNSTTPLQLLAACWKLASDAVEGTPRQGGKKSGSDLASPALELTLPSGKVFIRAQISGPQRVKADVWDKIRQERDQPQKVGEIDPWLNKVKAAQSAPTATHQILWQSWKGTGLVETQEDVQMQLNPPANITDMVVRRCDEMKKETIKDVEWIRDPTRGEFTGAATQMRSVQEALGGQQMITSKVEE